MRCPNDNTDLIVTERQGIEIHSCPICQGTWLRRGELDEIINRSIPQIYAEPSQRHLSYGAAEYIEDLPDDRVREADKSPRRRDKYSAFDDDLPRKGKRKKSRRDMLEDVLDF